ncbi:putative hydrolase of the HAD superfamily [Herbihabitans rhizosphaerae]|uniref:Putative hydrolase of the HAD superfamily n=1 Tax=Herbihabitans rhizosphaerae TaxID=1872711 RepID=A0A4Q7KSJ8_9PSEU|nr:HAD family hydrolase [Herbihabitans rhizosphaerae]RZS39100.1 putative hydrolase of the HAD superfamily [Herbihabitans rhizosphaerae]
MIRAVCLDIDDTLVDFATSARSAVAAMIGRDDMWPAWERVTEEHVARAIAGEIDYDTMRRARTKAFLADCGALLDDDLIVRMEDRRLAFLNQTWRTFDDAVPCLEWLRSAGFLIGAITNSTGAHQRDKLARLGIAEYFDTVVIAGEIGCGKPDPVIFATAAKQLDVPPEQIVHVGDRLDLDAVGARDAGMHGIWLDRAAGAEPGERAVHVITSLEALPKLLVSEFRTPPTVVPSQQRCR